MDDSFGSNLAFNSMLAHMAEGLSADEAVTLTDGDLIEGHWMDRPPRTQMAGGSPPAPFLVSSSRSRH